MVKNSLMVFSPIGSKDIRRLFDAFLCLNDYSIVDAL